MLRVDGVERDETSTGFRPTAVRRPQREREIEKERLSACAAELTASREIYGPWRPQREREIERESGIVAAYVGGDWVVRGSVTP